VNVTAQRKGFIQGLPIHCFMDEPKRWLEPLALPPRDRRPEARRAAVVITGHHQDLNGGQTS
jgi:hypothetical protein